MAMNPLAKEVWENKFGDYTRGQDECGAWIDKAAHGKQGTYGWEMDHIVPRSRGGTDDSSNLQPLHWMNNDAKQNSTGNRWQCAKED